MSIREKGKGLGIWEWLAGVVWRKSVLVDKQRAEDFRSGTGNKCLRHTEAISPLLGADLERIS